MKIYVVFGSTGEYSDRSEWLVAAYVDEALAKCHVAAATKWYQDNDCFSKRGDPGSNPFDPGMHVDYTGTHWFVQEAPLLVKLPDAETPMPKRS